MKQQSLFNTEPPKRMIRTWCEAEMPEPTEEEDDDVDGVCDLRDDVPRFQRALRFNIRKVFRKESRT